MHSIIKFPSQRSDSDHDFDLNTCIVRGELGSRLVSTEYSRGTQLCSEGQPAGGIFSICTGQAKEYCISSIGKTAIIRIVDSGDIVGLDAVLGEGTYQATVEAIEPITAYFITTRDILSSMRSDESFRLALLRKLSHRCKSAYKEIRQFGSAVPARVARFLLDQHRTTRKWDCESGGSKILNRAGRQHISRGTTSRRGRANHLRINLTREEIAQSVGTSRETVSRIVTFLQRKGWILVDGNHWQIQNGQQLAALAMQQRSATEDLSLYAA